MSSTTFIDGQTVINAAWLNDVNTEVYTNTHVNSITAGTDITVSSNTGNPTIALAETIHSNTTGNAASASTAAACTGNAETATTAANLASTLGVADGGTGLTTLTANGVMLGNGTSTPTFVTPSTSGKVLTSNGTTWVSQTLPASKGLGLGGETWHTVTGSRSFNTTYTNSYSYPIMVSATTNQAGPSPYVDAIVNGVLVTRWFWQFNGSGAYGGAIVIVPPGATYALNSGNAPSNWAELY